VLSPSTPRDDRGRKLLEYQRLLSVHTIVLIETAPRLIHVFERLGPAEWRNRTLVQGVPLDLRTPPVMLTVEEIFGPEPVAGA